MLYLNTVVYLQAYVLSLIHISIAQVHAARLKNGASVVVKVQRPGIRDTMARDIALLRRAAGHLGGIGGLGSVVDFRIDVYKRQRSSS